MKEVKLELPDDMLTAIERFAKRENMPIEKIARNLIAHGTESPPTASTSTSNIS